MDIQQRQEALDIYPADHPHLAGRVVGTAYMVRYDVAEGMDDVEMAIQRLQYAIDRMPEDHPNLADRLQSLGAAYYDKYEGTGAMEDLEMAIQQLQQAVARTPADHPVLGRRLENLGAEYLDKYRITWAMEDIEMAVQLLQEAIDKTPKDHPDRGARLQSLGSGYHNRYERTGVMKDLDMAIARYEEAIDQTRTDHLNQAELLHSLGWVRYLNVASELHSLGSGYHDRYKRTGVMNDLEMTIQRFQEAIDQTSDDNTERPSRLQSLGRAYLSRYNRTGVMGDLEMAIQLSQEATDSIPQDHLDRAGPLHTLGDGYRDRYIRTGAMEDLEMAIQRYQESMDYTSTDHPNRTHLLHSLGLAYVDRYERTKAVNDLETAIQLYQEAISQTPTDHPGQADLLHSLGAGYHGRYIRTGAMEDLEMAIQRYQESMDYTPTDHPNRTHLLHSLGSAYVDRYERTEVVSDLETAIQLYQEAISQTPEAHPEQAGRLHSLGRAYYERYARTGSMKDLEIAIQRYQESMRQTPTDHPTLAELLHSLGLAYCDRYERTEVATDLETAIRLYEEALNHSSSPLNIRLGISRPLLTLYATTRRWSLGYEAAISALSLIPLLTPRSLDNSDKQYLLASLVGLASDSAAIALLAGKSPYEAVRLLELGRGIIIGSMNELRGDISDLQQEYPELTEKYLDIRNQLDSARLFNQVRSRYDLDQQLEQTIHDIRVLPGFDRFLLAPSEDEFKSAALRGPIVIINVSVYRCDALIIRRDGLETLPLPSLQSGDIWARAETLENLDSLNLELLEWLWKTVAAPVLDALGYTQTPRNDWPHIWWIPTGPLARFPIHAAGHYSGSTDTVLDRAISSYSFSATALFRSRQNNLMTRMLNRRENIVLVGMDETPGHRSLQFVSQEIDEVAKLCATMQLQVDTPPPCREEILSAVRDCKIFHFAGHGLANPSDPSQSSLLLSDKALTVADLFEMNLYRHKPFLAYLSACGTGQIKHDGLIDEGLHLIGAYQLAGFQHVIGTLWEVNDKSCVDVATMTYEWIQKRHMSDDSVSEGLHRACRALRLQWFTENSVRNAARGGTDVGIRENCLTTTEQSGSNQDKIRDSRDVELFDDIPLYWVPYVHFGI